MGSETPELISMQPLNWQSLDAAHSNTQTSCSLDLVGFLEVLKHSMLLMIVSIKTFFYKFQLVLVSTNLITFYFNDLPRKIGLKMNIETDFWLFRENWPQKLLIQ